MNESTQDKIMWVGGFFKGENKNLRHPERNIKMFVALLCISVEGFHSHIVQGSSSFKIHLQTAIKSSLNIQYHLG